MSLVALAYLPTRPPRPDHQHHGVEGTSAAITPKEMATSTTSLSLFLSSLLCSQGLGSSPLPSCSLLDLA